MGASLEGVLQSLAAMERYFRGGDGWGRFALHKNHNGKKCLVGAVTSVRASSGGRSWVPTEDIEAAQHFIQLAIGERGWRRIENFNDTRLSYSGIAKVIVRAKELAVLAHAPRLPAPAPAPMPVRALPARSSVPEFLPPPVRPALPPPPFVPHTLPAAEPHLVRMRR